MTPTHVLKTSDGQEYAALKINNERYFADGTGWVSETPVPDTIVNIRPYKELENAKIK